MKICGRCEEQSKKTRHGKPHDGLITVDEARIFKGRSSRGFEEQDYQCQSCNAKFTRSTDRNALAWTLWQG